jgi:hypothetical protein
MDDDNGDESDVLQEEDAGDHAAEWFEHRLADAQLAEHDERGAGGEAEAEVAGFQPGKSDDPA